MEYNVEYVNMSDVHLDSNTQVSSPSQSVQRYLDDPQSYAVGLEDSGQLSRRSTHVHQVVDNVAVVYHMPQSSEYADGQPDTDPLGTTASLTMDSFTLLGNQPPAEQWQEQAGSGLGDAGSANPSSDAGDGSMRAQGLAEQASSSQPFQPNWGGQGMGARDDGGDEGENGVGGSLSLPDSTASEGSKKYACPYYKYNPFKYVRCQGVEISSVISLKRNHLYTHHYLDDIQCDNCGEILKSLKEYHEHKHCVKRDFNPRLGVDKLKHMKLANKGHVRNGSEQDKWYGMFDILFGSVEDARRPDNPYSEDLPTLLRRATDSVIDLLPLIFSEALESIFPSFDPVDFRRATQRVANIRLAGIFGIPSAPSNRDEGQGVGLDSDMWDNFSGSNQQLTEDSSGDFLISDAGSSFAHQAPDDISLALERTRELFFNLIFPS